VIYNASNLNDYDVNEILPKPKKKGHWKVVVNHEKAGIEPILGLVEGKIPLLKSHSILVVHD
jgi:pullulanase